MARERIKELIQEHGIIELDFAETKFKSFFCRRSDWLIKGDCQRKVYEKRKGNGFKFDRFFIFIEQKSDKNQSINAKNTL